MRVEIDQSGKVENTAVRTVIADSLGNYVVVKGTDKQKIQHIYRTAGKPRVFVIHTFSLLVAFLIAQSAQDNHEYWIDIEYPGKNDELLFYILYFCRLMNISILPEQIHFTFVGKRSVAHGVSYSIFRKKRIKKTLSFFTMMQYILPQKKDRGV